jgi:hypothetical protein
MARHRRKKGRHYGRKGAISVAMAAPLIIAGYPVIQKLMNADIKGAADTAKTQFASPAGIAAVGVSFAVGYVMHKISSKVGINRMARKLTLGYLEV